MKLLSRRTLFLSLVLLLGLAMAACAGIGQHADQASRIDITFKIDPDPPGVGPSQVTVTLTDERGSPVEGADVVIRGDIEHATMEPRLARARVSADGRYTVPFVWAMEGDWMVTVAATLADGSMAKRQFNLTVEEALEMGSDGHDHDDHDHPVRIPNRGAVVRIVSPEEGALFQPRGDVRVEIETENFELGEEINHWHIYVDDQPGRMIMGQVNDAVLRDLEPGEHQISAYLSVGAAHDELEEGATINVTVAGQSQAVTSTGEGN